MMFSKEKVAAAARELADHLQIIESVKALQIGQKEIADAIGALNDRMKEMEMELRTLKAETKLEAVREVQAMVNAVQGGLNQRMEDLAVKLALSGQAGADVKGAGTKRRLKDQRQGEDDASKA